MSELKTIIKKFLGFKCTTVMPLSFRDTQCILHEFTLAVMVFFISLHVNITSSLQFPKMLLICRGQI